MKTMMEIAMTDAGVKKPRVTGKLKVCLAYLQAHPGDQAHPNEVDDVGRAVGLEPLDVARVLNNAVGHRNHPQLRRTVSSRVGNRSRYAYWWDVGAMAAPQQSDLVVLLRRVQQAEKNLAEARIALQQAVNAMPDDLRNVLVETLT